MLPFALLAYFVPYRLKSDDGDDEGDNAAAAAGSRSGADSSPGSPQRAPSDQRGGSSLQQPSPRKVQASPSICDETMSLLRSPIYLLTVLAYSQYTAVVQGVAFYGPLYIQQQQV